MKRTRWYSLRRHLLVLLLGGVTMGWLMTMTATYIDIHHEIDELVAGGIIKSPETDETREELTEHLTERMLYPALFGLPVLGLWIWLSIRSALRPLDEVARDIATRDPTRLEILTPQEAPNEIRPLVEAINQLFGRVERTMASEKRFTADAAHELRTPLAALATQAQVAQRARNAEERQHAIEQLITGSRRLSRLVDQLLTLARLDPDEQRASGNVDLAALAEQVCADHGGLAMDRGITLELDASHANVAGDADLLRILLRNIVDNAIRYTPAGGRVLVTTDKRTLTVSDTGPGIPADQRQRVFDRFQRLAGQDKEGSGLGLSIVARIAERHQARIVLSDADDTTRSGLRVSVEFPA